LHPSKRTLIVLGLIVLVGGLVAAGSAFTASNTVPNASLGQGANTISGYTVSSVVYTPNGSNPANIDSVSFTISPSAAGTVEIQLVSGGAWYTCSNSSGSVTCATTSPQATAGAANSLNVVAGQ
jgi:FlaG/FlaF family flagellin (archaellin)